MNRCKAHSVFLTRRGAGLTLLHVLAATVLISAFGLIAARLFLGIQKADRYARDTRNVLIAVDRLAERIRADVWGAYAIAQGDQRTVVLRLPDNLTVSWHFDREGGAERVETRGLRELGTQRWTDLPPGLEFVAEGPWLMIVEPGRGKKPGRSIGLLSQLMLIRRAAS